jgi:PTS system nitrogen regulatory IIA component
MDIKSQKWTYKEEVMTLGEVSRYLKVSEKTVLRMIKDGRIPCAKVAGQWRFFHKVIDDWLLSKMRDIQKNDLGKIVEREYNTVPLSRLVRPEFIILDIEPGPKRRVLEQLVEPFVTHGIISDANDFLRKLLQREHMVSTAVGRGVAIPHVRNPAENASGELLLCIGICRAGTDFEALDRKPTHLFFLIHTDSVVVHLRTMAKLTALLTNDDIVRSIMDSKSTEDVIAILVREEQRKL